MLKSLLFIWHYKKKRFSHAMAVIRQQRQHSGKTQWALYRLNMYRTVVQTASKTPGWREALAKTVSLAACGEMEAARSAVVSFIHNARWARHRVALAEGLAPFLPREALRLIEGQSGVSPSLHIALLLRNGQGEEARHLLENLPPGTLSRFPELHLLYTNAFGGTPSEQILRLNICLAAHGVPSLSLPDPSRAPSPLNIASEQSPIPMDGPLISVLMTTFNTGARAEAAVMSVLTQSHRTLELIIVDDASHDDTPARMLRLAAQDPRIRLIQLPRNVGTYVAKRIGLMQASGEFVTCHDSDDWSHPEKLARQLAPLLTDPSLVCTVSNWIRMQDDGTFYARPVYPLTRLNPSSPLFRREQVLREAGAWDCVRTGADSEFLARLKLVFGAEAIRKVNQPLTLGSHREDSLMTAAGTGYTTTGVSPPRQVYWESWSQWHIRTLAVGERPFIDANILEVDRPFAIPSSLQIDAADIHACHAMAAQI